MTDRAQLVLQIATVLVLAYGVAFALGWLAGRAYERRNRNGGE